MNRMKLFLFKIFKLSTTVLIPSTAIFFYSEFRQDDQESNDAINFIPFDDFYDKGYFNVDTSNNNFVLKGFNLDKKTNIQTDIDTNKYNAFYIPNYVTSISSSAEYANIGAFQYAFSSNTTQQQYISNKITSIIFDSNNSFCSSLGKYCFDHCDMINFVSLSDSISSLGDHCFSSCLSLSTVLLSKNLKVIPWYCFGSYSSEVKLNNLTISIPEGVETIDRSAFEGCSFDSITFPSTIKSINDSSFKNVTISSMDFMTIDDSEISSISFSSSWADGIKSHDTTTNKIKVFLPKGKNDKYTAVSNFVFLNQEINNGLIYKNAFVDNPVVKLNNNDKYLNFSLYPDKDVYANYMDSDAQYDFSCESSNRDTLIPNLSNDDILQGKMNIFLLKKGSSQIKITETCNKLTSPLNFLDCFVDYIANSLTFKDVQFNSYSLKSTDSPITTDDLNENVYDSFDEKVSDVTFSIVDNEKETYTLPDWITLNESTGSLKISPNDSSQSILDIRIKVEQTTTGLIGYSDQFSIIISDVPTPEPTRLIIDNNFETLYVNKGQTISTPDLTNSVVTEYWSPVTTSLVFSCSSTLPSGLSFDSQTGKISGTIQDEATSSANIRIKVEANVDEKKLFGFSNFFSIIINGVPISPTKLLFKAYMNDVYTYEGRTISIDKNLLDNIITDTGLKVNGQEHGLKFTLNGELPQGLSFDQTTGKISGKILIGATSSSKLSITASANYDGNNLTGSSNLFDIIINDKEPYPTSLLINYHMTTYHVNTNDEITTPSLIHFVSTNLGDQVSTNLTFSTNSILPKGLEIDETTGAIYGKVIEDTIAPKYFKLQIHVQTTIDDKVLDGQTNTFEFVLNISKGRHNNVALLIITLMFAPVCLAALDVIVALAIKRLMFKIRKNKKH